MKREFATGIIWVCNGKQYGWSVPWQMSADRRMTTDDVRQLVWYS